MSCWIRMTFFCSTHSKFKMTSNREYCAKKSPPLQKWLLRFSCVEVFLCLINQLTWNLHMSYIGMEYKTVHYDPCKCVYIVIAIEICNLWTLHYITGIYKPQDYSQILFPHRHLGWSMCNVLHSHILVYIIYYYIHVV